MGGRGAGQVGGMLGCWAGRATALEPPIIALKYRLQANPRRTLVQVEVSLHPLPVLLDDGGLGVGVVVDLGGLAGVGRGRQVDRRGLGKGREWLRQGAACKRAGGCGGCPGHIVARCK